MGEEHIPEHCIFATNTSAIPIRDIAAGSSRPQNVIGMHYFSPVPQMPLLEIITHDGTADEVAARAVALGTKQGKTCVVVKDVPGFYVNRCLGPFLVETCALLQDGVGIEELDKNIKDFGMPVGPISLADEVGIDVAGHVAKFLSEADMGVRMTGGNIDAMSSMIEKGWLGKKTGKGFFVHPEGKGKKTIHKEAEDFLQQFKVQDLGLSKEEQQMRIITRFTNEAVLCLQEGIVATPLDGDVGMVFGTGFPPFMGGPFRMLDNREGGVAGFVDTMLEFQQKYGD